MKPNIDLTSPITQRAIEAYDRLAVQVLDADRLVENAVYPIYSLCHGRLEHTGSCVLLRIKSAFFLLSASHIFDAVGDYAVSIGTDDGNRVQQYVGDRFSSARGISRTHRDDPIDASVYHLKTELPEKIKAAALSLDDLILTEPENSVPCMYGASGFRIKKTKRRGQNSFPKRELFPTAAYAQAEYAALNLSTEHHLALAYENQVLVHGRWQTSPIPRGFSGGALIKYQGIPTNPAISSNQQIRPALSAITIEHRRETQKSPGALIGTKVNVHIELIKKYLPNLF